VRKATALSAALGVVFLSLQVWSWTQMIVAERTFNVAHLYIFTFYVLTGLHGLHVVGGLIPLVVVARRAAAGRYGSADHNGLVLCAMYWHFLDVVWITLFVALQVASVGGNEGIKA
jgi:cytochrome c oxidase subunit 3